SGWLGVSDITSETEILIHVSEAEVWISIDKEAFSKIPLSKIPSSTWRVVESAQIVMYDAKKTYHVLHDYGVEVRFDKLHDIAQGAFLLNPLLRDRSLAGLAGNEIDEANPGQVMAALWAIYKDQIDGFEKEPKI